MSASKNSSFAIHALWTTLDWLRLRKLKSMVRSIMNAAKYEKATTHLDALTAGTPVRPRRTSATALDKSDGASFSYARAQAILEQYLALKDTFLSATASAKDANRSAVRRSARIAALVCLKLPRAARWARRWIEATKMTALHQQNPNFCFSM